MNKRQCYALILGASSGFGRAAALALAAEGFPIIGVHLDRAAAHAAVEELKNKIQSYGVRTLFFNANAADANKRAEIIAALRQEFAERPGSGVYLLLHSLAFGSLRPLVALDRNEAITQSQLEMTLDVMANSLVYWVQELYAEGMLLRRGRILSLTSAGSHRNLPMYGAVSAAKAALESYARQLALELAPMEITVNAIRAGVTDTPALRKIPGNERLIANAIMRNPNHRLTTPDDVAKIIALLARPEAQWINAHVLGADGGEDAIDITWWEDPTGS
ncbi:MAG: SDR family oxidoreductase [Chlorobi bacterium]|nr:SDR family oxidoreductase [Chlorobiota bacterium]